MVFKHVIICIALSWHLKLDTVTT